MKIKLPKICIYFFITILSALLLAKFVLPYKNNNLNSNYATVHFIDVGQGDCILINVNNTNLLIDSGPSDSRKKMLKYISKLNIKKLNYIIATHPHEDHIGNMDAIIHKYSVEKFLAPKVTSSSISFENMITALNDKNLKIVAISSGNNSIDLGPNTSLEFYCLPNTISTDNLNLFSPIIKFTYKNTSFLFTGDAEFENEEYLINNNINLNSDILKVGHHGSNTSTSESFLKAVSPKAAIISVGANNTYGHPTISTLNILDKYNIETFRTDIYGNIVVQTNGQKFSIFVDKK